MHTTTCPLYMLQCCHQISVPGGVIEWTSLNGSRVMTTRSHWQERGARVGAAMSDVQEGEVQCIMGDGHMGTPTVNRQTWLTSLEHNLHCKPSINKYDCSLTSNYINHPQTRYCFLHLFLCSQAGGCLCMMSLPVWGGGSLWRGSLCQKQRPPPWTVTTLDRDPPGQRSPWTETPLQPL